MADAAAWGALISILMKLYPNNVTTIAAWTEMLVGFGYMIGMDNDSFGRGSLLSWVVFKCIKISSINGLAYYGVEVYCFS